MFKMIASDIDGTLVYKTNLPSDRTKRAVKAVKSLGVPFVLTTGRRIPSAKIMSYALDIADNPLISNCGSCILLPSRNEILYSKHIPKDLAFEIGKIAFSCGVNVAFYENVFDGDEILVFSQQQIYWMSSHSPWYGSFFRKIDVKPSALLNEPIQISLSGTSRNMHKAHDAFKREFEKDAIYMDYGILKHGDHIMDIFASGTSKANALEVLMKSYEISNSDLVAFGDGINDLEMLSMAGLSVAMENAPSYLKQKSKVIAPSSWNDGVAHVIEDLISTDMIHSL